MSALHPKADIGRGGGVPVRLVPKADIGRLLDHLVGAGREPHWHVDTQRPGGLEIEHELELDGLDHGQLAWLIAS